MAPKVKAADNCKWSANFSLSSDGRHVQVDNSTATPLRHSLLQWNSSPLNDKQRWFSVKILSSMDEGQDIMLGTNPKCTRSTVAWNMNQSLRYRSLEGGVFTKGGGMRSDNTYGTGDTVVCFLEKSFPERSLMNFFLNGRLIYRQWVDVTPPNLCPAIGVNHGPLKLEVTWPGFKEKIPDEKIPINITSLSSWIGCGLLSKDDVTNVVEVTGKDDKKRSGCLIHSPRPTDRSRSYFEVKLLTRIDPDIGPAIGLTPAWTNKFQYPGWKENTLGYHGDDGGIYQEDGEVSIYQEDGSKCGEGDRMGCGIVFNKKTKDAEMRHEQPVLVYFTKNGGLIYSLVIVQPEGGLYPTVGMLPVGEKLEVKYPCSLPALPKNIDSKLVQMEPLFGDFRFSQRFCFENDCRNNLTLTSPNAMPRLVQYTKSLPNEPYFEVEITNIGKHSVLQLGVAPSGMSLQGEALQQELRDTLIIRQSVVELGSHGRTAPTQPGDKYGCFMEAFKTDETVTCFTINGRMLGRVTTYHHPGQIMCPSISGYYGPVSFKVKWPDDTESKSDRPDRDLKLCSHWIHEDEIQLDGQIFRLQDKINRKEEYFNALAPVSLPQQGYSYFEMKVVAVDGSLPGIGITKGTSKLRSNKGDNATGTIIFFPSLKQLYTAKGYTGQGVNGGRLFRPAKPGDVFGVLVCQVPMGYTLHFSFLGEVVATHSTMLAPGGLFPVLSFPRDSIGASVAVMVEDDPEEARKKLPMVDVTSLETQLTILDYNDNDGSVDEKKAVDKLSSVENVYISCSPGDNQLVQPIIDGIQDKGYEVQTTIWNVTSLQKTLDMDMADIVVFCVSLNAGRSPDQLEELVYAHHKQLSFLPVVIGPSLWPPAGQFKDYDDFFRLYDDLKIDFVDQTIGEMEIGWLELGFTKSIELTKTMKGKTVEEDEETEEEEEEAGDNSHPYQEIRPRKQQSGACRVL